MKLEQKPRAREAASKRGEGERERERQKEREGKREKDRERERERERGREREEGMANKDQRVGSTTRLSHQPRHLRHQ